ncbi:MAG: hypothetical protein ACK55Z_37870, partial [bacterium]
MPMKAVLDMESIITVSISVRFSVFSVSHSFPILPDFGIHPFVVRSTTMWPFSAAALAILPKLDPPMNTVLPVL